jgi:hypothetical protein
VFKGTSSGISTVIATNHQDACFEMRADKILPEKRRFSAIFTRPNFGTSRKSIANGERIVGHIERLA